MYQFILIIHVLTVACLIILVLVQQGKGAAMGAAFGSGASQTVFGSRGTGSFLMRVTVGFALLFFTTSIVLNYLASKAVRQSQQVNLPATPLPVQGTSTVPVVSPSSLPPVK
ncbi:MAG: secG [Gammaproteobacteria bacterium]|jgi:preprotein translocase subunit SecG|nr:secG [Gammaproteobacteria bacterium]